jgi:hypothetical protein
MKFYLSVVKTPTEMEKFTYSMSPPKIGNPYTI